MSSTTTLKTIEVLHALFTCHRIPKEVVSNNGLYLVAVEIIQFIRQNGVKVKHVLPYHPALIGAEELSEHMAKLALTKPLLDAKTITVFLTLTVRDLPTDSCCPKEKAKPLAVS